MKLTKSYPETFLLITGFLVVVSALVFCFSPWGRALDLVVYDSMLSIRGQVPPPEPIVIVAIDEPSFGVIGRQWPWPRRFHAELIDRLFQAGARTVALDILFAEPSDAEEDAALAAAINRHSGLVLVSGLEIVGETTYVNRISTLPLPEFLSNQTRTGVDSMPLDPDGFVRKSWLTYSSAVSLAYAAAFEFGDAACRKRLQLLKQTLPEICINFVGPPRSIKTISYYQALEPTKYLTQGFFKDKLVFVGFSIKNSLSPQNSLPDHYPIPFVRWGSGYMAGVEIQATSAANLIQNNYIRYLNPVCFTLSAAIVWSLAFFTMFRLTSVKGAVAFSAIMGAAVVILYGLLIQQNLYGSPVVLVIPASAGYLFSLLHRYFKNSKEKRFIRQTFARYVSPTVVQHLLKYPEQLKLGGEFTNATVLFLDIKNFSILAEQTPADELVSILSRYLGGFADIVFQEKGMIDKIVGDGMMAVWGVPAFQAEHAMLGCRTSLAIMESLRHRHEEDIRNGRQPLSIRIGINSGTVLAGNVGGKQFSNYTVHGEDVNFAARLEVVNKHYDTGILIGTNTAEQLSDDMVCRKIDIIKIKGKHGPQTIYELLGFARDITSTQMRSLEFFAKGRHLYEQRLWKEARQFFEQGLALNPKDGPGKIYQERCWSFEKKPPGDEWDSTYLIKL